MEVGQSELNPTRRLYRQTPEDEGRSRSWSFPPGYRKIRVQFPLWTDTRVFFSGCDHYEAKSE